MSIQDSTGCNKKKVLFDNQNVCDSKTDKLTAMMSKLTILSSNQDRHLQPKIYQGKGRGQGKTYIMTEVGSNVEIDYIVEINSPYRGGPQYGQNFRGETSGKETSEGR